MAIDKEKLKHYAELLEEQIDKYKDSSEDARFLAEYDGLQDDIADAKARRVTEPRWDHGLGYWLAEKSRIRDCPSVSTTLSRFRLLLRGRALSEDKKTADTPPDNDL